MILPNDGPNNSYIVKDAQQNFHDLRGRLTVILGAADRVREDPVTPTQEAALQHIETTAQALADALTQMGDLLAATLTLPPPPRRIWHTACLRTHQIDPAMLNATLTEIRAYYPMHDFMDIIVIAPPQLLLPLRTVFATVGCSHIRIGTLPADVPFLLDTAPAELIAMAPPSAEEETWWRTLRPLLRGYRHQPILLYLKEAVQQ